jgi:hypothetical protein
MWIDETLEVGMDDVEKGTFFKEGQHIMEHCFEFIS